MSNSRTVSWQTASRLSQILNFDDARASARRRLPRAVFEYVDGGSNREVTRARNSAQFDALALRQRIGEWVQPDLRTTVLGRELAIPVLPAPCGGMRVVHPDGDIGVAQSAETAGTVHVASSASGYTIEDIAAAGDGPKWFQLYTLGGRPMMESLVERAKRSGYEALVVTADTAVNGNRERDVRNGFSLALKVNLQTAVRMAPQMVTRPGWVARFAGDGFSYSLANTAERAVDGKALPLSEMARALPTSQSPTWEDIAWVRENWSGPMLIKGLYTPEDARRAVDAGADGVIVSNHGGRQLDGAPSTVSMLPSVVDEVGDEVDVLMDSGVRSGTDVIKAMALGAKAVLIGRMTMWGLAVGGRPGVDRMFELIRNDMIKSMQIMGCPSVSELDRSWLLPA
ncbi:alpha-hydroxy acid oxidase [Microbacterium sp. A588]